MINVNEGDVPCCFSPARNTIKSEFIYASSVLLACSQNVAQEIRSFLASKADPCTFVKPSYDRGPKIGPPGNEHEPINTKSCNEGPSFGSPGNSGSKTMQKPSSNQSPQFGSPGNDHQSIIEKFRKSSSSVIVLTYVYDCILLARDRKIITKFIVTLKFGPETFVFTDEGIISKCLGVDFQRLPLVSGFTVSQPFLIKPILASCDQNPQLGSAGNDSDSETMRKYSCYQEPQLGSPGSTTQNEEFPAAPTGNTTQNEDFPAAPAQTAAFPAAFTEATSAGFTFLNVLFKTA